MFRTGVCKLWLMGEIQPCLLISVLSMFFWATTTELNICKRDNMAYKTEKYLLSGLFTGKTCPPQYNSILIYHQLS